ncbi:MAG: zinc-dependent metalloprotease [Fimbriimonadaceae bacterium]|nr:zinc-dependent metalloprotease [Fimbriimonadaceae bacterium]
MVRLSTRSLCLAAVLAATMGASSFVGAQPPTGPGGGQGPRPPQAAANKPKPYEEVITKEFKTQDGVFKVHRKDDKVYFEIPKNLLGRDFLWITELKATPVGGFNGSSVNDLVVGWERRGDKILLRQRKFGIRAEKGEAIKVAVDNSNVAPIVQTFDVESNGPNDSAVIDVTRFYTTDPAEISVASAMGGGSLDASRTFLEDVFAFPTNINVTTLMTFRGGGGGGGVTLNPFGGVQRGASNTGLVHYSMVLLPEEPMMGRLTDSRVGYFSEGFEDYGTDEHRMVEREFITRHRLEKKDPSAAISDPVKPIVYYVSREVPEKWREYVKKGIEDWQVAFEQAGFRNAIIAKDAPTLAEDPSWSPEDARYNVIRWAPTPTENAMGPNVHDPRSGEIISAHIIIWHNILQLNTKWYFSQVSPLDKRAQRLPFPDDLMGDLVRYVVAHEVGHTLGLQHNFKASAAYTIAQLRSPEWTNANGDEASIMDYGRFNYVAQPGDGARLIPLVAPYDKHAIEWGYKPIPGAKNPMDEKRELDALAAKSANNPLLRFGANPNFGSDPSQQSEDLGSDGVEATRLGFKNLERVMSFIIPATTKLGESYDDLNTMYGEVWGQYNTELGHLLPIVGGSVMVNTHAGRGGRVFHPVAKEQQRKAVNLIGDICFRTPKALLSEAVLNKVGPSFGGSRLLASQTRMINGLLSETRLARMLDMESKMGGGTYTVREMIADMRGDIVGELAEKKVVVDAFRRPLQRAFVQALGAKMDLTNSPSREIAMAELKSMRDQVRSAQRRAGDRATKEHLAGLDRQISDALLPKTVIPGAAPAPTNPFGRGGIDEGLPPVGCWGDH